MKKSSVFLLTMVPLIVIGLFLWHRIKHPRPSQHPVPVTLKIDWIPSAEYYGFYYAQQQGLFQQAGFTVTIESGGGAPGLAVELAAATIDFGTTTSDNLLKQLADGAKIRAAMPIHRYNPCSLAVRSDHKLSATNKVAALSELKGLTIGTNQQASVYTQFLYALKLAGATAADIKEYPIGYGGAQEMLDRRVDAILAYTTNQVVDLSLNKMSYHEIMLGDVGVESYGLVLVASTKTSRLDDNQIKKLFNVVQEGYDLGGNDIPGAVRAIRKEAPSLEELKLTAAIARIKQLNETSAYDAKNLDRWLGLSTVDETIRTQFERMLGSRAGGFYTVGTSR